MTRPYCPDCEPEADPTKDMLILFWCHRHQPSNDGEADAAVRFEGTTNNEAGGESNAAWCAFIHAKRPA